jgi:hypothetical protein
MSSGHASHKSTSSKPNINTNGLIDEGGLDTNVEELLAEGADALRAAEAPENAVATQRPEVKREEE